METLREKVLVCGVAARTLRGEGASGDQHLIHPCSEGMLIAVVDGLGHGLEAAHAARTAVTVLKRHAGESLPSLVKRCQAKLVGTRGVAASIASFDVTDSTMTWLGVGNVEGVLVHSETDHVPGKEFLLLGRGFIGGQLPELHAFVVPVVSGDTLTLATDGVTSSFHQEINVREQPQKIANRVLSEHGKGSDDALVLVARFVGNLKSANLR
jgi:negative regulator of sigma-B (phosphoserine phosphatase)